MTTQTKLQPNKPSVREPMTWLFVAYFKDGSTIVQGQDDKSRVTGKDSAFYDVQPRIDEVVAFELQHVNGQQVVGVDLKSGNFVVNGTPIAIHDQHFEPSFHKLRLIYFTETRVEHEITGTVQEDGSIKGESTNILRHYANRYFIGWQTTVGGKNKQVTLAVG